MKRVSVYKANDSNVCVDDVRIEITSPMPDYDGIGVITSRFYEDALDLFKALRASLPGGTFDQLLALMLREKASHFVVPYFDGIQDEN
jgi:hypothetical protein